MSLSFDNSEAGCMLFYDCHRAVPAPFLTKTYHLVNDPSTDEIVSWGEDDTTFVVWRPPEFARDLLPNYFKHNNFSSFVRQLNTYGFRKVVPDRWEFANDFFRKGERHLLCEIHRRKALQPASCTTGSGQQSRSLSPSTSVEDQTWSPVSSPLSSPLPIILPPPHQNTSTISISDENERLRQDNCLLLSEVSRLRRLYEDAIKMFHHQIKGPSPDLTLLSRIGGQSVDRALPTALQGESAILQHLQGPGAARSRERLHELSVHVRTTNLDLCKSVPHVTFRETKQQEVIMVGDVLSTGGGPSPTASKLTSSLSGKLTEVASSNTTELEGARTPLKLFGVPLQHGLQTAGGPEPAVRRTEAAAAQGGRKRHQPDTWETVCDVSELNVHPHDRVFPRPPRKCLRSELATELRPSTVKVPWLQICSAPRDGGVYI